MKRSVDTARIGRLLVFVYPYRSRFAIALVAIVVASILSLAGPYTLQFLIDAVFKENDLALLNRITLILIGIFAAQSAVHFVRGYLLATIGERVMADLRVRLFQHLQGLSLSFFNQRRTGELVSRLTNDVATIRGLVTGDVSTALSHILTFFGALVLIIITDWRLTLFMLALIPTVMVVAIVFGRRLRKLSASVQDGLADATTVVEEALSGIRVVKSFSREAYETDRFSRSIAETVRLALRRIRLSAVFGPLITFLGFSAVVSIFWFGGREVLAGRLTAGQLFMFLVLTMTIAGSIGQFSNLWSHLQEALGATERIFELLDTQSDIVEKPDATVLKAVSGRIRFEGVSFAYMDEPEERILNEIDLEVETGEVLALVGPSGAGKTTLVNLIPRFFDPTGGTVQVDGHDLREVKIDSLRAAIAIVPQETLLFGGSVRENILYGRLDATEAEMIAAAEAANAHEFITQFPNGYETTVGERGVRLSGGQRQRIAIARALLKDPRILLLDEATSSLDSESEGRVQEALERLMQGRTTIVIAHRLSTVRNADRIAVLDAGRIVEVGTHEALLGEDGMYSHLYRLQFRVGSEGGDADLHTDAQDESGEPKAGLLSFLDR
ncbi:MAG TPA: ABC transporter transmembrane domain-containing protein [Anaerolineales bacterium]|nr:ABC transporter transmembrane domain-containing protein [Anaerolineales bacterium]